MPKIKLGAVTQRKLDRFENLVRAVAKTEGLGLPPRLSQHANLDRARVSLVRRLATLEARAK